MVSAYGHCSRMTFARRLLVSAFVLLIAATTASATEPKRVLLLHSFGPDFAPWNEYAKNIRAELNRDAKGPMDIHEVSIATARFPEETGEPPLADYLHSLFAEHKLDLVITIGAPAARFFQKYRQQISPATPVMFTALEQRRVPNADLAANETSVAIKIDFIGIVENILKLLPETNNIAVVIGNSPIEKYWLEQVRAVFSACAWCEVADNI
jgi:hypothetical protein